MNAPAPALKPASTKNPRVGNDGLAARLAQAQAARPAPASRAFPLSSVGFDLPPKLEAAEPPEARGLARDAVKLMVSYLGSDEVRHARFNALPDYLEIGDVLAINTSGTLKAALEARRADGTPLEVHLSTHLPAGLWTLELRVAADGATTSFHHGLAGETLTLASGGRLTLHTPYHPLDENRTRLWMAWLHLSEPTRAYLEHHGFPNRYSYVRQAWPSAYYQTVYATEPGSAEMPSAGRAFTAELITQLVVGGVQVAPLILHTGVASLEDHELPYEEYCRVPDASVRLINEARRDSRRVIAVGTTVVRALGNRHNRARRGPPGRGLGRPGHHGRAAAAGRHRSAHRAARTARQPPGDARRPGRRGSPAPAYAEALRERYLWHEFGDLHLMLPE